MCQRGVVLASVNRAEEGRMEKTGKASRKGAQEVFTVCVWGGGLVIRSQGNAECELGHQRLQQAPQW